MKRFVLTVLPVLATFIALGVGVFLFRPQLVALRPRLRSAAEAVTEAIEEVVEVQEVVE